MQVGSKVRFLGHNENETYKVIPTGAEGVVTTKHSSHSKINFGSTVSSVTGGELRDGWWISHEQLEVIDG